VILLPILGTLLIDPSPHHHHHHHHLNLPPTIKRIKSNSFEYYFISLGNKTFREEKSPELRQSDRISSPVCSPSPAWVYPKECNLCLKYRVQHKSKKYEPYQITTFAAQTTIKAAAKVKNEKLYNEIKDIDLIAK
jgi:hypothetical protein